MHCVIGFLFDMYRYGSDYFFATSCISHTHSVCQGRRAPGWLYCGYVARSCRPSSPVRLSPSSAGLQKEIGRLGI